MFLSAVSRPRYVDETDLWWDGKIGTWSFTHVVPAVRSSANRSAGTLETKSMNVTKYVYRSFLVDRVLPAIVSKCPGPPVVMLQNDNASAHVTSSDTALFLTFDSYAARGWQFSLVAQPPNSPDTNILDLGFLPQSNLYNTASQPTLLMNLCPTLLAPSTSTHLSVLIGHF
ncbi:Aste57867_12414 [Aphanomyces stellatus]|uniref:Aste57867_12414 protein n=1 Tax=Aphanomyces stellatus TaxID=120398 RepID=A0A485KWA5_9STRA|nr:hypothetical protein As57867_012368 [Aphanomyces stellatus]VFT89265.1 Aste57867_12414 [Aphanomyces stellatus]